MNRHRLPYPAAWPVVLLIAAALGSCDRSHSSKPPGGAGSAAAVKASLGPEGSPVKPTLDKGWCGGHGVPESVCTRCDDSLIDTFKNADDWCKEHNLPETQCTTCHPEVAATWATLKPAGKAGSAEHVPTPPPTEATAANAAKPPADGKPALGPDTSPIKPTLDKGWCGGHGVPESVCTRCDDSLIDTFKKAGDWCKEHDLPETQCFKCHPEVDARWAALKPGAKKPDDADKPAEPASQPVAADPVAPDKWCFDHGVPKEVCTRCDASLIQKFKDEHDWCKEHGVPESQCTLCNPEVREKWEALRPAGAAPGRQGRESLVKIERNGRLTTSGENDPLCLIETSTIRFLDPSIAKQAGIEVTTVRPRRMSAAVEVPAEVEFDATRVTRITPRVSGIAREVRANLGDSVQVGDVLAVLDSVVLGEAKSQYIERQQDFRVAEGEHARNQTIYEGTQRLLAAATSEAAPSEIQQRLEGVPVGEAKARLLRAHAAVQLARADAAREAQLFETKINAEKDVQMARATLAAAEADFLAIREEIAFTRQKDQFAAERALQIARSGLDGAKRRLQILGLQDEQIVSLGAESGGSLSRYELRSPAAGRIVERSVVAGEAVEDSHALFVIADTSRLWLLASVYERDLPALRENQPVLFTVDDLTGHSSQGRLSWISSQVDDKTRLIPVRAELDNADGLLRARMFGRARIVLRDNADVLSVPVDSVQTDGCCQLVFVRETDDVFTPRKLWLGASGGGYVEVLRGLREGEAIVTAGSFLMKTEILKGSIGAGCCEVETGR
ncbi:MAG: efflux RND transporter periplasmic adaptor subunit [Phycisphaerae bacterium]|nr:efflux RND transporter periplasmic adaptor subunit [Phycisphaerae bacterium]